jgi:hypothetical protein
MIVLEVLPVILRLSFLTIFGFQRSKLGRQKVLEDIIIQLKGFMLYWR